MMPNYNWNLWQLHQIADIYLCTQQTVQCVCTMYLVVDSCYPQRVNGDDEKRMKINDSAQVFQIKIPVSVIGILKGFFTTHTQHTLVELNFKLKIMCGAMILQLRKERKRGMPFALAMKKEAYHHRHYGSNTFDFQNGKENKSGSKEKLIHSIRFWIDPT